MGVLKSRVKETAILVRRIAFPTIRKPSGRRLTRTRPGNRKMPNVSGTSGDQTYGPATNRTEHQVNTSPRLHTIVGFVDCLLALVRLQTARRKQLSRVSWTIPCPIKVLVTPKTKMLSKGS